MVEIASIIILGITAQWFAWKFKIPAILPLILIGLLVGPISTLISEDGSKWIEPVWNGHKGLFPGDNLFYFVSLAISIILFEGGLTLKLKETSNVGPVITKLITLGSLITFLGGTIATHYILALSWPVAFLFSALIIVTGPTVITPILRNIPLKRDISAILKWEGILIDPIGALFAVLVYEFISVEDSHNFTIEALTQFGKIVLVGGSFGFTFARGLSFAIKKHLIPHYLLNVFSLAAVLLVFVISDSFAHESGLLAVVVMGMVMGNIDLPNLKDLLYFKESLSVLLISALFILLSANINIVDLELIYNWKTLVLFFVIVFGLRPLSVFACTTKSSLKTNEKLFISWVGPRGIVAAGMASLFGQKLVNLGVSGAEYITPLVFIIVLGTVLLNATTARFIAKILGVFLTKSEGVLIIGAGKLSLLIAEYLSKNGKHCVLVDSNGDNVQQAQDLGLDAIKQDLFSGDLNDNLELSDVGYIIALTSNSDINQYALDKYREQFGENGCFRLINKEEMLDQQNNPTEGLFCYTKDSMILNDIARDYPVIRDVDVNSEKEYQFYIKQSRKTDQNAPLFIKSEKGQIDFINYSEEPRGIKEGYKLIYLGVELEKRKA